MRYAVTLLLMLRHLLLKSAHSAHARTDDHTDARGVYTIRQRSLPVSLLGSNVSQHRKTIQLALLLEVKMCIEVKILYLTRKV